MIRLKYVLRRHPNLSLGEFQHYWRRNHAPLVAKHAETLNIRRYLQAHTIESPFNDLVAATRGAMQPYDGIAELWWNDFNELADALATPEAQRAAQELVEDERRFIDLPRSALWFVDEQVIVEM